jgi:hypothetical protein
VIQGKAQRAANKEIAGVKSTSAISTDRQRTLYLWGYQTIINIAVRPSGIGNLYLIIVLKDNYSKNITFVYLDAIICYKQPAKTRLRVKEPYVFCH